MKKLTLTLIVLSLALLTSCDKIQDILQNKILKSNALRIGYTDYSFDQAIAFLIKGILDQQPNLKVELYKAADSTMFKALAEDQLDIAISAWLPNSHQRYLDLYPDELQRYSLLCDSIGIYMIVPTYAPLEKIDDLKAVAGLLKNTILIPENQNAIFPLANSVLTDYGLTDFTLQESTWDNIIGFVDDSLANSGGFAFIGLRPHWIFKRYDLKTVSDPKHTFGNPEQAYIVVNSKFEERMPSVADFLRQIRLGIDDIERMMELNQVLGSEPYENALKWISDNTYRINKWLLATQ
jgi:glycine betaine/proline transport system substrate-binding protein